MYVTISDTIYNRCARVDTDRPITVGAESPHDSPLLCTLRFPLISWLCMYMYICIKGSGTYPCFKFNEKVTFIDSFFGPIFFTIFNAVDEGKSKLVFF